MDGPYIAIQDWIFIRGDAYGPLLLPITKGGTIQWRRMSSQAVYNILQTLSIKAGIERFTPNDLRRTLITHLIASGIDIRTVSSIVGHSEVQTTAAYVQQLENVEQDLAAKTYFPYKQHCKTR